MVKRAVTSLVSLFWMAIATPLAAAELVMVEQKGCTYCMEWHAVIGPIYPQSPEGAFAPLRRVDLRDGAPDGMTFDRKVSFTPTFILVENGRELGRIEGYPGEDFFWGLLGMMLKAKTDYQAPTAASSAQRQG
ncbi:thioredoxin family protein [Marimonas arenosa]|uniref:Thioredoxin family protein n=1 Tax=Marimonas arenosa TaxID=1795305 RepID=A0AAE3WEU6_9RHOB|nr:thioredoxin family protein [Marimonas arenosa]MDQ2091422.1 thioredoxin family protein [Marimonas arenosa]